MKRPDPDDDATVLLVPPAARRRRVPVAAWVALVVLAAAAGGGLGWQASRTPPPAASPAPAVVAVAPPAAPPAAPIVPPLSAPPAPTPPAAAPPAPPVAAAPPPAPVAATPPPTPVAAPAPLAPVPGQPTSLPLADEATILAHAADQLTAFRFAPLPAVVVLDFPSLQAQGEMLDRVAAFCEKAGLPRDRVLSEAELMAAIRAHNDTVATYYYGHDYPAAQLQRFFALADQGHVTLGAPEEQLRAMLAGWGLLTPGSHDALVSLSRAGADPDVTPAARAAILHHELSHGAFFTDAAYAGFVRGFWRETLTEKERAAFRRYLGAADYDPADEELMLNEAQAYLVFTQNPLFFRASEIGMAEPRRAALIADFARRAPPGWPHDALAAPASGFLGAARAAPTSSAGCRPGSGCR